MVRKAQATDIETSAEVESRTLREAELQATLALSADERRNARRLRKSQRGGGIINADSAFHYLTMDLTESHPAKAHAQRVGAAESGYAPCNGPACTTPRAEYSADAPTAEVWRKPLAEHLEDRKYELEQDLLNSKWVIILESQRYKHARSQFTPKVRAKMRELEGKAPRPLQG
ncbi:MAG: hypothetical protein ACI9MR_000018 [Myxococcota bacterium]|jgi:hypothetical protein